jgi:predicted enzyme related to lactoylglutathione lyase
MTGVRASVEITIDTENLEASAVFWESALGYRRIRERDGYVVLAGPEGDPRPGLIIQGVETVTPGKARVHMDLRVPDPSAEVERLTGLGAAALREVDERARGGSRWTVMVDPQGTVFCVCPAREER